jgi:hypothetical protein
MMTEERLNEIRAIPYVEFGVMRYGVVLELIAEVERLRRVVENAVDIAIIESRKKEPVFHWDGKNFVPHVGPPDTTPCVQVPVADARDGGL